MTRGRELQQLEPGPLRAIESRAEFVLPREDGQNAFAPAIDWVLKGRGAVRLVSPYFTPKVIVDLERRAGTKATLLTDRDFLAWNLAGVSDDEIAVLRSMAAQNRLLSLSPLHAKIVLRGDRALVGSANLTTAGLGGNVEVSVTCSGAQVNLLSGYLDDLWARARPIGPELILRDPDATQSRRVSQADRSPREWVVQAFPARASTTAEGDGWAVLAEKLKLDEATGPQVKQLFRTAVEELGLEDGHDASFSVNWRLTTKRVSLSVGAALVFRLGRNAKGWDVWLCSAGDAPPRSQWTSWNAFGGKRSSVRLWRATLPGPKLDDLALGNWRAGLRQLAAIERGDRSPYNRAGWLSLKGQWLFERS